jgi:hypothetical protein
MTVLGYTISPAFGALVMADVTWFDAGVKAKSSGHLSQALLLRVLREGVTVIREEF